MSNVNATTTLSLTLMSSATSDVTGNGSEETKALLKHTMKYFGNEQSKTFASSVVARLQLAEVTIKQNAIEPQRQEGLVVYKISVDEGVILVRCAWQLC